MRTPQPCLTVRRGEFLAIVGHNGAGKSTTAELLAGLHVLHQRHRRLGHHRPHHRQPRPTPFPPRDAAPGHRPLAGHRPREHHPRPGRPARQRRSRPPCAGPDASASTEADNPDMSNEQQPPGWEPPPGQRGPAPQPDWGTPPGRAAQPPPPRRSGRGKIVGCSCLGALVLVIALIVAIMASSGGDDDEPDRSPTGPAPSSATRETPTSEEPQQESGPRGDVKVTACEVDPSTSWAQADLLITNRSSKASNYVVQVEFVDASGTRLGEASAAASNVAPEQKVNTKAQGLDQITTKVTCRITDVTRYAS
ncbi:ATP-binding cassette domain-containing protein [Streptomyces sp. ISL-112]|nr:ATP-binding cassette domain-containing protein [Streptomyces sp. ISL-112]MBT2462997.1 ATP-binding cassette domain-containing protein [Streptomyces sp. ISL-63]